MKSSGARWQALVEEAKSEYLGRRVDTSEYISTHHGETNITSAASNGDDEAESWWGRAESRREGILAFLRQKPWDPASDAYRWLVEAQDRGDCCGWDNPYSPAQVSHKFDDCKSKPRSQNTFMHARNPTTPICACDFPRCI